MKKPASISYIAHILLIEDRPAEMRLLLDVLHNAHFQISIAFEGMQGYGRAVAQQPDLILLDVNLGQIDGFTVCRLLKADPSTSHIPLIFITSAGTLADKLTGLAEGAVDYIQKPFEPAEVVARMRIHLKVPDVIPDKKDVGLQLKHDQNSDQFIVRAAALYIKANLARMPTLREIARSVGTHEKRLTKVFRQQKEQSVFEFVREQRFILVLKLLTQTPMTIADVAAEAGFSSPSNFATAFRAVEGISPSNYRRRQAHHSTVADAT
jgi:DNA-binding response OmpR family regulator